MHDKKLSNTKIKSTNYFSHYISKITLQYVYVSIGMKAVKFLTILYFFRFTEETLMIKLTLIISHKCISIIIYYLLFEARYANLKKR